MRLDKIIPATAALIGAALLTACVSFGEDPPPFMLTLTADDPVSSGQARSADAATALVIEDVVAPQKLSTLRVPVSRGGNTIAYLKDAYWVERPNRLFRDLIAEKVGGRTDRLVMSPGQASADADTRLEGQLIDFGLDGPALQVVVTFDAIARDGTGRVRQRRFDAREPVGEAEPQEVGEALNIAANRVAGEVADWFVE